MYTSLLKETHIHTKEQYKINKQNDHNGTGKDDTRQVLQPYFHSGPT